MNVWSGPIQNMLLLTYKYIYKWLFSVLYKYDSILVGLSCGFFVGSDKVKTRSYIYIWHCSTENCLYNNMWRFIIIINHVQNSIFPWMRFPRVSLTLNLKCYSYRSQIYSIKSGKWMFKQVVQLCNSRFNLPCWSHSPPIVPLLICTRKLWIQVDCCVANKQNNNTPTHEQVKMRKRCYIVIVNCFGVIHISF